MDFIEKLGLEKKSPGASTGSWWDTNPGPLLEIVSPVDAKAIGSVSRASIESYQRSSALRKQPLRAGVLSRPRSAAKL